MELGTIAYLGIGSNLDEPLKQVERAIAAIGCMPRTRLLRVSPFYVSAPWGKLDQPDFLNAVIEIRTALRPEALLKQCKKIEVDQGRILGERWGPRQVDVDILLYDDEATKSVTLVLPHPRMWERAFVLRPLADLRPDMVTPSGEIITSLLSKPEIGSQGVWPYDPGRKSVVHEG